MKKMMLGFWIAFVSSAPSMAQSVQGLVDPQLPGLVQTYKG